MEKRWRVKPAGNETLVEHLSSQLNINSILANLLVQRGIDTFEKAKSFFRPSLNDLHDPFLMKDMDKAIQRIETSVNQKKNIMIFGDYDVDGTTAVATVFSFFSNLTDRIMYYIPDRQTEGYGISYKAIDLAADNDITLIIALDCGIKDIQKINYATNINIDFIICDHHQPGNEIPKAIAVLDPKRIDCPYPFKELSGCGIGFKLIQAYAQKNNIPFNTLDKYFDLVAISSAADIVPIIGENRILTFFGLKKINTEPRTGIEALLKNIGINRKDILSQSSNESIFSKKLNVHDLVFVISPRINAAGRIDQGDKAVELLICRDEQKAMELAVSIEKNNTERKSIEDKTLNEATAMIQNDPEFTNKKAIIVFHPDWHKGVVGIVASKLVDTFYKPTLVLTQSNGMITGSARSVKNFDVYQSIEQCSDLLENFGGHKYAAGLTIKPEQFEKFTKKYLSVVAETISEDSLTPELTIDAEIDLNQISDKFFLVLKQFAPFGPGNMSPVFLTRQVRDKGSARIVKDKHLKLNIVHPFSGTISIDAIAFDHHIHFEKINNKTLFNICYTIEENEWNGIKNLQLKIKNIAFE